MKIEAYTPKPPALWSLVDTWKNGKVTTLPAQSREEAVAAQSRVSLRGDLMQRLELRYAPGGTFVLWDNAWPQDTPLDILSMPDELAPEFRINMLCGYFRR